MPKNALYASLHPCWTGRGYSCGCMRSEVTTLAEHRAHLKDNPQCVSRNATYGDKKWLAKN